MRKIAVGRMLVCGSPKYLRKHGVPKKPEDLSNHECLGFLRGGRMRTWAVGRGDARTEFVPRGRFATDNAELLRDAAVDGMGLVCLLDFMVRRDVDAGALRVVLGDEMLEHRPIYALQPLHRHASTKVRAFVDHLVEAMGTA